MTERMHVLHLSKTGGSALKTALAPFSDTTCAIFHNHDVRLRDVPHGEKLVFLVRDPVTRFVSGFNSRLREGRPRNNIEWTKAEALAFGRFATPTALAEGLASPDAATHDAAVTGMSAIYHLARPLGFWLETSDYLAERRDDITFIGVTDRLDSDFQTLLRLIGAPPTATLPLDEIGRHATPANYETHLTGLARRQIEAWYAADFPIYQTCLAISRDIILAAGRPVAEG